MSNEFGLILAGGIGARVGSNVPKQYMKINGKEAVSYAINTFRHSQLGENFILVCNEAEFLNRHIAEKYGVTCIQGGTTRNESIGNGIDYIAKNYPQTKKVIIHDAVRPFIQSDLINFYFEKLENYDAVITAGQITDSLSYKNNTPVNREEYYLIQTPEAFRFPLLQKYFDKNSFTTTALHQFPETARVYKYFDQRYNLKITYPEDILIAEQFLRGHMWNKKQIACSVEALHKKKVLVLGGSGGLGKEIVENLRREEIEFRAPTHAELDLRNLTVASLEASLADFHPDVIINCAAKTMNDDEGLSENFDEIFAINTKAILILIEYARRLKKEVNLVLISSSSTTKGRENITLYSASKAALNSMVESLARGLAEEKIYLNAIVPERIKTPLFEKQHGGDSTHDVLEIGEVLVPIWYLSSHKIFGNLIHIRKGLS